MFVICFCYLFLFVLINSIDESINFCNSIKIESKTTGARTIVLLSVIFDILITSKISDNVFFESIKDIVIFSISLMILSFNSTGCDSSDNLSRQSDNIFSIFSIMIFDPLCYAISKSFDLSVDFLFGCRLSKKPESDICAPLKN